MMICPQNLGGLMLVIHWILVVFGFTIYVKSNGLNQKGNAIRGGALY